jgi:hypothetical protein
MWQRGLDDWSGALSSFFLFYLTPFTQSAVRFDSCPSLVNKAPEGDGELD